MESEEFILLLVSLPVIVINFLKWNYAIFVISDSPFVLFLVLLLNLTDHSPLLVSSLYCLSAVSVLTHRLLFGSSALI